MNAGQRHFRLVVFLFAAFVLHAAFANSLSLFSAKPNLAITGLLVACLFTDARAGAWLGFLAGLLEGAYASLYLGSILVTRSLAGFLVGALEERVFRDSPVITFLIALVGTLFIEGCFYLFAPRQAAAAWLTRWLSGAAYNAVIAIPSYLLLRRLVKTE